MNYDISEQPENTTPGKSGLVLEGGGLRGIYSAGVVDVLIENQIRFDGVAGVSAGGIHGSTFMSRQQGRGIRLYLTFSPKGKFMGFRSWLTTGDFVNFDFAYQQMCDKIVPYDYDALETNPATFYAVCSNLKTGQPYYYRIRSLRDEGMQALRASASLPIISKPVTLQDRPLLDGGTTDSIPVQFMRDLGYTKTVIILTRVAGYRKQPSAFLPYRLLYKKYPDYLEAIRSRPERYNQTLDLIDELEKDGKVLVLRPSQSIPIDRLERNPERILAMYELGRRDMKQTLEDLKQFLNS